jgi:hypothetical protein
MPGLDTSPALNLDERIFREWFWGSPSETVKKDEKL